MNTRPKRAQPPAVLATLAVHLYAAGLQHRPVRYSGIAAWSFAVPGAGAYVTEGTDLRLNVWDYQHRLLLSTDQPGEGIPFYDQAVECLQNLSRLWPVAAALTGYHPLDFGNEGYGIRLSRDAAGDVRLDDLGAVLRDDGEGVWMHISNPPRKYSVAGSGAVGEVVEAVLRLRTWREVSGAVLSTHGDRTAPPSLHAVRQWPRKTDAGTVKDSTEHLLALLKGRRLRTRHATVEGDLGLGDVTVIDLPDAGWRAYVVGRHALVLDHCGTAGHSGDGYSVYSRREADKLADAVEQEQVQRDTLNGISPVAAADRLARELDAAGLKFAVVHEDHCYRFEIPGPHGAATVEFRDDAQLRLAGSNIVCAYAWSAAILSTKSGPFFPEIVKWVVERMSEKDRALAPGDTTERENWEDARTIAAGFAARHTGATALASCLREELDAGGYVYTTAEDSSGCPVLELTDSRVRFEFAHGILATPLGRLPELGFEDGEPRGSADNPWTLLWPGFVLDFGDDYSAAAKWLDVSSMVRDFRALADGVDLPYGQRGRSVRYRGQDIHWLLDVLPTGYRLHGAHSECWFQRDNPAAALAAIQGLRSAVEEACRKATASAPEGDRSPEWLVTLSKGLNQLDGLEVETYWLARGGLRLAATDALTGLVLHARDAGRRPGFVLTRSHGPGTPEENLAAIGGPTCWWGKPGDGTAALGAAVEWLREALAACPACLPDAPMKLAHGPEWARRFFLALRKNGLRVRIGDEILLAYDAASGLRIRVRPHGDDEEQGFEAVYDRGPGTPETGSYTGTVDGGLADAAIQLRLSRQTARITRRLRGSDAVPAPGAAPASAPADDPLAAARAWVALTEADGEPLFLNQDGVAEWSQKTVRRLLAAHSQCVSAEDKAAILGLPESAGGQVELWTRAGEFVDALPFAFRRPVQQWLDTGWTDYAGLNDAVAETVAAGDHVGMLLHRARTAAGVPAARLAGLLGDTAEGVRRTEESAVVDPAAARAWLGTLVGLLSLQLTGAMAAFAEMARRPGTSRTYRR